MFVYVDSRMTFLLRAHTIVTERRAMSDTMSGHESGRTTAAKLKLVGLCLLAVSGLAGGAATISFVAFLYYSVWKPLTTCAWGSENCHFGGEVFGYISLVSLIIAVLGGVARLTLLVLQRRATKTVSATLSQQSTALGGDISQDVLGELQRIRAKGLSADEQERQIQALRERFRRESGPG